ncbi:hypothetical protein [Pseudocnuella soli]|uniref:hypothetical protein n=1 Tax=Pseudocnuella soli TaxID=2502779 RepID=UPI00104F3AF5|nr:hypothetical protein [Pseudocnuella soli]
MKLTKEQMDAKWKEFEAYLDEIDVKYAEELKPKGSIRWYVGYGVKAYGDISYVANDDLDPAIAEEVKAKLKEIFP